MPAAQTAPSALKNIEKAAMILLSLDQQSAGEVLNFLKDDEIQRIGSALLHLQKVPTQNLSTVLEEFSEGFSSTQNQKADGSPAEPMDLNGRSVVEKILQNSLPTERGKSIWKGIGELSEEASEDQKFGLKKILKSFEPMGLHHLIKDEHPQLIAVVLSMVVRSKVKLILEKFEEPVRIEIYLRMAQLEKISSRTIEDLKEFFQSKLQSGAEAPVVEEAGQAEDVELAGIDETVLVLKTIPRADSTRIIEDIAKISPELAQEIEKRMFTMEDLERADDAGIRELLRSVRQEDLKIALKNVSENLQTKFLKNMSERASLILKEDMEAMAPVKVEEVEAAQNNILQAAKDLIKEDKLKLAELTDEE